MNGPGLLAKHLKATKQTQAAFAAAHGFSEPLLSMWLSRKRRPGLKAAFAMEEATGGAVPASSWLKKRHGRTVADRAA